jgi:hypothetical protein
MTVITTFPDMLGVIECLLALGTMAIIESMPLVTHRAAYKALATIP